MGRAESKVVEKERRAGDSAPYHRGLSIRRNKSGAGCLANVAAAHRAALRIGATLDFGHWTLDSVAYLRSALRRAECLDNDDYRR